MAVRCEDLGKRYRLYDSPRQRLVESVARRAMGGRRLPAGVASSREVWALRQVSFEVERGETLGIIGANGSGKSTLLQIIAGTVTPTEGRVAVEGRLAALLELGAGFTPECTGVENVRMNAAVLGLDRAAVDERLDAILAFADIGPYASEPVRTYSSGMFLRLAFAVAVHVDPDVLIIDEALAVGDVAFQAKCVARIRRCQEAGTTLLFVSHDLGAVRSLCTRCLYLDRGTVRSEGPAPLVVDMFLRDLHQADADRATADVLPAPRVEPTQLASGPLASRFAAFAASRGASQGTGDALIRLVELTRPDGSPTSVVDFGDEIVVHVWVEAVRSATVSVNYKIRDRYLIAIAGADFLVAERALLTLEAGRIYHVAYTTRVALKDGDYTIRASVTVPIDRHDRALFVDVVEVATPFTALPSPRGRIYTQVYLPNSVHVEDGRPEDFS